MAEMTIRLRINPTTGKKDVVVSLRSDADALPHEHEQMHRALVEKLLGGGLVRAEELGQLVIERETVEGEASAQPEARPEADRAAQQSSFTLRADRREP